MSSVFAGSTSVIIGRVEAATWNHLACLLFKVWSAATGALRRAGIILPILYAVTNACSLRYPKRKILHLRPKRFNFFGEDFLSVGGVAWNCTSRSSALHPALGSCIVRIHLIEPIGRKFRASKQQWFGTRRVRVHGSRAFCRKAPFWRQPDGRCVAAYRIASAARGTIRSSAPRRSA